MIKMKSWKVHKVLALMAIAKFARPYLNIPKEKGEF
jgi:hypothetical protein